jgi:hypothetical protein
MNNDMHDGIRPGYWFKPKRVGFGVTPVTWQGWIATFCLVALFIADTRLVRPDALQVALGAVLIVAYIVLAWVRTDGGWRWRSGREER